MFSIREILIGVLSISLMAKVIKIFIQTIETIFSKKIIVLFLIKNDMTFFYKKYRFSISSYSIRLQGLPKTPSSLQKKRLRSFCDFHSIAIVVYIRFVSFVNSAYSIKK